MDKDGSDAGFATAAVSVGTAGLISSFRTFAFSESDWANPGCISSRTASAVNEEVFMRQVRGISQKWLQWPERDCDVGWQRLHRGLSFGQLLGSHDKDTPVVLERRFAVGFARCRELGAESASGKRVLWDATAGREQAQDLRGTIGGE